MSGDYLFPKRLFRKDEPLETDELNEVIHPAGERLNGHLNQHNIRAPISDSVSANIGTFFRTLSRTVDVDPSLSNRSRGPRPGTAFDVRQNTSWHVVGKTDDTKMQLNMETGRATLTLTAHASHCYHNDDGSVREVYAFLMPGYGDGSGPSAVRETKYGPLSEQFIGVSAADYAAGFVANLIRLSARVYLNAPGLTAASASYNLDVDLPAPGGGFRQRLATKIAEGTPIIPGPLSGTVQETEYFIPNSNGGGFFASTDGEFLLFEAVSSGTHPGAFRVEFTLLVDSASSGLSTLVSVAPGVLSSSATTAATASQDFSDLSAYKSGPVVCYFGAQIQYAFRIDGAVLTETITGRYDNEMGALRPLLRQSPLSGIRGILTSSTNKPVGAAFKRFGNRPDAVNVPMHSVRLTATVEVEAADHVIELVVRRVPCGKKQDFRFVPPPVAGTTSPGTDVDNRVMIYNRMLTVAESPLEPASSALFEKAVVVPAYKDEDVVDKKNLYDERLNSIVTDSNQLKDYQVSRGAINGDHLADYSSVLAVATGYRSPGSSLSFFASAQPYVRTGGSTPLLELSQAIELPRAATWIKVVAAKLSRTITAGTNATVTVEGNVFLDKLLTDAPNEQMHLGGAFFCVAFKVSGNANYYMYLPSVGWANSNSYFIYDTNSSNLFYTSQFDGSENGGTDMNGRDFIDIPVTATLVFDQSAENLLKQDITEVAIFGSGAYMTSLSGSSTTHPDDTLIRVKNATVNAVVTRS